MGKPISLFNIDESPTFPAGLPCYVGATAVFNPPATPTDLFYIQGVANKIIKIWQMGISMVQTTAGINTLFLIKRSAANSGGTAVATTKVPIDSNDQAASALVQHYTANPTINGTVGNIWSGRVNSPAPATAGIGGISKDSLDFIHLFGDPIVLRSAAEAVAFNFAGAALPPGLAVTAWARWTEEG